MAKRRRRKHEDEFLGTNEQELADFCDHAAIGLHWLGPDGYILCVDQTELDLLGYSREEYVGHHISEFHADPEVSADLLHRLARDETLHRYEARLRGKNGAIKHVLISTKAYRKNSHAVHTRCVSRDISEHKQMEEALRTTQERYHLATRATQDVIWDWDMVTDTTVRSEVLSDVLAYSMDQVPCEREGAYQWFMTYLHPEDVERVHASF